MSLDIGTLAYINYTAKIKDVGEIIEVTVEDEAKKLGVYDPAQRYEPKLVAIGEGWVLKGLDEALMTMSVGKKMSLEVPPEKGFGQRDPSKVKMISLRKFGEKASDLRIGNEVEIDNKIGIVRFVGSGRAQIDFNHRLAGKTLLYEVELVKIVETDQNKIVALIKRRIPMEEEKLDFTIEDDSIKIQLPNNLYLIEGIQIIKRAISNDLFKFIKTIRKVYFIELYESKKPSEISTPKEEKIIQKQD